MAISKPEIVCPQEAPSQYPIEKVRDHRNHKQAIARPNGQNYSAILIQQAAFEHRMRGLHAGQCKFPLVQGSRTDYIDISTPVGNKYGVVSNGVRPFFSLHFGGVNFFIECFTFKILSTKRNCLRC
jgi:hypothetical protein